MSSSAFRRLAVTVCSLLLPVGVFAMPVSSALTTPDSASVSRGDFIRASIQSLNIPLNHRAAVHFRHAIPDSLLPYVQTAAAYNALQSFGSDLLPDQHITRGQALEVLMHLENLSPENPYTQSFSDVSGSIDLTQAVELSLEKSWLLPESQTMFGVNDVLSGADARALLQNVLNSVQASSSSNTAVSSTDAGAASSATSSAGIEIHYQTLSQPLPDEDMLRAVWQLLNDQYLYKDKISSQEAAYRAAEAIVDSLNDPYTVFMRPINAEEFNTQLGGEVTGIGAQVEYTNNILTIVAPISGSPAEKANLQPGDQILAVDGTDITNIGFLQAVNKIRGPKGTTITLHIRRNGSEFDVKVTRDTIQLPEIDVSYQGSTAVVKLAQFGQTTDDQIRSMLTDVASHHPTGIILDLRNNPGGLLDAAEKVLSNFLPKGSTVAHVVARDGETTVTTGEDPVIDPSTKVVVLVNKGSASASEITAAALQDYKRATILGTVTYGKGTVQQVLEFKDGSNLKMTIAEWLSPLRHKINHVGVTPDVMVPMAGSGAGVQDDQMLRALNLLR
ncbi:MAG TPA: S41 family peptidase [Candidatus Peribacteraceae bacterium]|nr:S41 family peptidase [Candidatus Peribacteraceae bacterium]